MTDQPAPATTPAVATTSTPATGVEFKTRDDVKVDPTDWAKRAADVRTALAKDGIAADQMLDALFAFRFTDAGGTSWTYNGTGWLSWNGQAWATATPPTELTLQPFKFDLVPDAPDEPAILAATVEQPLPEPAAILQPTPAVQPAPAVVPLPAPAAVPLPAPAAVMAAPSPSPSVVPVPSVPAGPTHMTPQTGLPAWAQPDPNSAQVFLAAGLPLAVTQVLPNGWVRVVASNGWTGWVNGQGLLPIGAPH